MRWSLRRRLFLSVGAGAAALALALSLLVDRTVVGQVQRHELAGLERTRATFAALQSNARNDLLQQCLLVSDLPYFKAAAAVYDPEAPAGDQEEALATIAEVAERLLLRVDADLLAVTDDRGRLLVAAGSAVRGRRAPREAISALAGAALAEGRVDGVIGIGGSLVQTVAAPMGMGHRTWGAICLGRTLDSRLAADLEAMSGSGVALVAHGRLVAASPSVPASVESALGGLQDSGFGDRPAHTLETPAGRFRISATPLPNLETSEPAWFVVLRSEEQALAFLNGFRRTLVLVAGAAIGAGLLLSFVFARRITEPVRELARHTEALGAGRLDARVAIDTGDELSVLGDAFNRMAAGLEDSRKRLEESHRALDLRRAELERANRELTRSHDEIERVNRDLRETHAQLLQAGKMAAFGELGASIAHELRQPLSAIRGFAQLIQLRLAEDQIVAHRNLRMIVEATDHMTEVVQGLKDFARKSSFERKPTDLSEVVRRTASFLEAQLRSRGIRLVLDLEATAPRVVGDLNQLQQVFTNLVANARDAVEENGEISVTTRTVGDGAYLLAEVRDTGPGIPPDVLPRIFQSFFTTKPEGAGTGLGLSITQSIVQDHGGTIEAVNGSGGGAVFRVFLPTGDAKACWEMIDCTRDCRPDIAGREECVVFRDNLGHRCWEVLAQAAGDDARMARPDCPACPVYRAKSPAWIERPAA